jgi:rare lipoprotein A (RlpA)-like double-psi beta-barrel protein
MRRALAFVLLLAATLPAATARAGAGLTDLRAERAALLARIAVLADRADQDQVAVVVAQARQTGAEGALSRARTRLERLAIDAYLYGLGRAADNLAHPNVYLEAAFRENRQAVAALRSARTAAAQTGDEAEAARDASRAVSRELEADRRRLEATISHQEALDAQLRAAAAARTAAVAAQEAARRAAARPAATTFVDRFETDPTTITRHRVASVRQQGVMGRWPFGPVTGVPAGLRATGQTVTGIASWYGPGFDGRATASGAIYDQEGWTCASKELPLGTILLVSENGRSVLLLVNDRGPYVDGWVLDLSHAAAQALGHRGIGVVTAQVLAPE